MPEISGSYMPEISARFSALKLKNKTLQISGDFIKFSECQAPLRQCNILLLKTFWRRFWFETHIISRDGFVAFDSLQFEKVTLHTSLHSNKQGINHRFLSLAYFTCGV